MRQLRIWMLKLLAQDDTASKKQNGGAGPVAQRLSSHVLLLWPRVRQFRSQVWTRYHLASHPVAGIPHIK